MRLIKIPFREGFYLSDDKIIAVDPCDDPSVGGSILAYEFGDRVQYLHFTESASALAEAINEVMKVWS